MNVLFLEEKGGILNDMGIPLPHHEAGQTSVEVSSHAGGHPFSSQDCRARDGSPLNLTSH